MRCSIFIRSKRFAAMKLFLPIFPLTTRSFRSVFKKTFGDNKGTDNLRRQIDRQLDQSEVKPCELWQGSGLGSGHQSNIAVTRRETRHEGFVSTHGSKHNHGGANTAKCDSECDGGQTKQQEWLREDPQNDSVEHCEAKQHENQKVGAGKFVAVGLESRVTKQPPQERCNQRGAADHDQQIATENKAINGDSCSSNPAYQERGGEWLEDHRGQQKHDREGHLDIEHEGYRRGGHDRCGSSLQTQRENQARIELISTNDPQGCPKQNGNE